jgi:hypothetical protein
MHTANACLSCVGLGEEPTMFGSEILDVAIGMIFVFLMLSLICSGINELIEAVLKNRANDLENGIYNLLCDKRAGSPTDAASNAEDKSSGLAAKLFDHQLIKGLYDEAGSSRRYLNIFSWIKSLPVFSSLFGGPRPSYIPSGTFALALWDLVTKPSAETHSDVPVAGSLTQLSDARAAVAKLTNERVRTALLTLIDDAAGDMKKARANIEAWFNGAMDRVSGTYKRRTQLVILIISIGVAVGINADALNIAKGLSNDATLRSTLVAAAQERSKLPLPTPALSSGDDAAKKLIEAAEARLKKDIENIQSLGLPIGWSNDEKGNATLRWPGSQIWHHDVFWAWHGQFRLHWFGWMLTAFAISLGSPFWFDLLKKFITIRSTIKPAEKPQEDNPK